MTDDGQGRGDSAHPPAWQTDEELGIKPKRIVTEAPTVVLHLPIPPSANRIWRKVPGMRKPILSEEYRAWINAAGWAAKRQLVGVPTILGAFDAQIQIPQKSRRDRDNWSKPLFDLCQRVGAVRDDRGLCTYTVAPADREDCMIALWDKGGAPLPAAKRGGTHKPSKSRLRVAPGRIAKAHRVSKMPL